MLSKTDVIRMWHVDGYINPPASMNEAVEKYFSDDFQGLDQDGNVISDKAAMVGMNQLLFGAFKDFKGVVHDIYEEDGHVVLTFHFEGTHTGDFDLSAMGLGVIPASGKRIVTPEGKTEFMIEGDQIVSSRPVSGGFGDLLAAIGALPPAAS